MGPTTFRKQSEEKTLPRRWRRDGLRAPRDPERGPATARGSRFSKASPAEYR